MDRQKHRDRYDEANTVAFRNFVNVPKNSPTLIVTSCRCPDRCLLSPCSGYKRIYAAWVYLIIDKKIAKKIPSLVLRFRLPTHACFGDRIPELMRTVQRVLASDRPRSHERSLIGPIEHAELKHEQLWRNCDTLA